MTIESSGRRMPIAVGTSDPPAVNPYKRNAPCPVAPCWCRRGFATEEELSPWPLRTLPPDVIAADEDEELDEDDDDDDEDDDDDD